MRWIPLKSLGNLVDRLDGASVRSGAIARRTGALLHCGGASLSARGLPFVKEILLCNRGPEVRGWFPMAS